LSPLPWLGVKEAILRKNNSECFATCEGSKKALHILYSSHVETKSLREHPYSLTISSFPQGIPTLGGFTTINGITSRVQEIDGMVFIAAGAPLGSVKYKGICDYPPAAHDFVFVPSSLLFPPEATKGHSCS